jgi:hypothetical protein
MTLIVVLFGVLIAALGITGIARPSTLMGLVSSVSKSEGGLYAAIVFRLVFGGVLILAAPNCRFPDVVRILGVISVVSALVLPVLGYTRVRAIVDWWSSRSPVFVRSWALIATAFGLFLVYAGL